MSTFAYSSIRPPSETSEETKDQVRKGSPVPTEAEPYRLYTLNPDWNLTNEIRKKIIGDCPIDRSQKTLLFNDLTVIRVKIASGKNDYEQLREDYGDPQEQLLQFDGFLKTQLEELCENGNFVYFHNQLNTFLYGEVFTKAFANISFNRGEEEAASIIQKKMKEYLEKKKTRGGSKTRKKCRRFRNNLRKNKISRKYIMLKQCGGGKAKMGSKSKPYSSKRKAMRSRRRVCYYKKKGRTLKMKKKAKKSRKKSRRRR